MTPLFWMKRFGGGYAAKVPVFNDLNLEISCGQVAIIRGGNGSGKTSVLLAVLGMLPCVWGRVGYGSRELRGPAWYRVRTAGMGVALQRLRVFRTLSMRENLEVACGHSKAMQTLEQFELFQPLRQLWAHRRPANTLSGGEQSLTNLACAVGGMARPGMLCLDEPLANVHAGLHEAFRSMIYQLREQGCLVVICEHLAGPVERLISPDHLRELRGSADLLSSGQSVRRQSGDESATAGWTSVPEA